MREKGEGANGLQWLLLGAVAGPALQLQQPVLWPWPAYAAVLAMVCVIWLASRLLRGRAGLRAAPLLAAALVAFGACGLRASYFQSQELDPSLEGRDIDVAGVIAAMPQRSELGQRIRFEVESATLEGASMRIPPKIQLSWWNGQRPAPELRAGERWQMTVRLKAPHGNLNPSGFDYELWMWEQGLQATGHVRSGTLVRQTWSHPVEQARQSVRDAIYARVADRKSAGLLAALVTGDQNAIDRLDWDVFRATGVAHLMSISGLHITMFAWLAALLVGASWRASPRLCLAWPAQHAALVGGVLLAAGYALFSGWGIPAQRTVWMLATVALLRLSGRSWPWPALWLLACAVVVTLDPWAMLQAGFWLSFVAVGVLFATGAPDEASQGWRQRLGAMAREQGVVTVALTPLSLLLFGQVSAVGLLANALAIPWVTLVVTPLAMGGVLVPLLWDIAAWAVQAMGAFLQWLASWPYATFSTPAAPVWAGAAGVAGGVLLAMRLPWHARLLGVPLMLPVLLWQAPRPPAGHFELLAADIGQGNAVIVRTAGHTLVYDAGPRYSADSDAGHRVLVPLLRSLGERLDTVVISHRDNDHSGGAAAVLAMQPQAGLLSSIEDAHELQSLRKATRCVQGQHWQWDGVDFDVLHPMEEDYAGAPRPNALSCVLRIRVPGAAALLAGDIEAPQEAQLLARAADLRADLLLVPHHGSKTSSTAAFLDAVQPRLAVVQSGYRNRFGHPGEAVVARLRERGAAVMDSPHCGALWWSSAQPGEARCQRDVARRYWHHRITG